MTAPSLRRHRVPHVSRVGLPTSRNRVAAAALREQRRFRLEQLAELAAADGAVGGAMDEVRAALREAAEHALADVTAALERIEAGTYGSCLACAAPIPAERLEIVPMAAYCMACQRDREGAWR